MRTVKQKLLNSLVTLSSAPVISDIAYHCLQTYSTIFVLHRSHMEEVGIRGTELSHLERCIRHLKKHDFKIIPLPELVKRLSDGEAIQKKTVSFTLDDGYLDQAEQLIPILLKHDIEPVFFLITDLINKTDWPWDSKVCWLLENTSRQQINIALDGQNTIALNLESHAAKRAARHYVLDYLKTIPSSSIPAKLRLLESATEHQIPAVAPAEYQALSWDEAKRLQQQGVILAPHSRSHNIFSCMPLSAVKDEITDSFNILQNQGLKPAKIFCYPTGREGDFNDEHKELLHQEEFSAAVSAMPGYLFHSRFQDSRYALPRIELPENFNNFVRYISWIEAMRDL